MPTQTAATASNLPAMDGQVIASTTLPLQGASIVVKKPIADHSLIGPSSFELQPSPRKVPTVVSNNAYAVQENFHLLEKWDGFVTDSDDETFSARLSRCDDGGRSIHAVFSKDELTPEERVQIEVGAPFVWTIGYRDKGTTRHRDSLIYFRRMVAWDERELKAGENRASKLTEAIGWK